jgi:hypothetical protein
VGAGVVGQVLGDQTGAAAQVKHALARAQLGGGNQRVELIHIGKAMLAEIKPKDVFVNQKSRQ